MGPDSITVLIPFGVFAMVSLIVFFSSRENLEKARARAEVQKKLLDKFTSSAELAGFLESPDGRRFLQNMGNRGGPKERILASVKAGIVLTVLGSGFFALMIKEQDLVFPAVVVFSLGLGFLIAAAISARLSRKWGLFEDDSAQTTTAQPHSS